MERTLTGKSLGDFGRGKLPCPEASASAVAAGVFGCDDHGVVVPSVEDVRSITEEHARELLCLTLDVIHLQRCWLQGIDPASGKAPRGEARRSSLRERIAREAEQLEERYENMLAAYAEGFGWPAADDLHQFIKETAQVTAPVSSSLVQHELF